MIKVASSGVVRVREVMTTNVLTIAFGSTLQEAATLLHEARVGGAPVVDPQGRVMGMLSKTDLLDPRRNLGPDAAVGDVMTHVLFGVRAEDPLAWAICLMVDEHVHRVVVTDEAGKLVGIVTALDVLKRLAPQTAEDEVGFRYVDLRRDPPA